MRRIVIALIFCYPLLLWGQADTTVTVVGESGVFISDAHDPVVEWLAPDGGEGLNTSEIFTGTWSASDEFIDPEPVTILFSANIGDTYYPVATDLPNNSSASISAPAVPTEYLRIKIVVRDQFGNQGWDYTNGYITVGSDGLSDTTTVISAQSMDFIIDSQTPFVDLLAPVGGESYSSGQLITCTWSANDNSFGTLPVAIGLTGGIGDTVQVLADNLPNTSAAEVNLPVIDTRYARIHIFAKDGFGNKSDDVSDGYLIIGNPAGGATDSSAEFSDQSTAFLVDASNPFVDLFSPNGGETYLEETNFLVTWSVVDENLATAPVTVQMATTIGGSFNPQGTDLDNDGQEVFVAPLGPVEYGQIRVQAADQFGNIGQDQSDGYFSIFESGTGAIQGYIYSPRTITGTLYLYLWYPGHSPDTDMPDRTQLPISINLEAGVGYLYSFSNLLPGSGYSVGAMIDQLGSPTSGETCDYGYDLSGHSSEITVESDLVADGTNINLTECGDYNNGDFSLQFDGIDDYMEIPDHPLLNPGSNFTISSWIYPSSWDNNSTVLHKGSGSGKLSWHAGDGIFQLGINDDTTRLEMTLPPLNRWTFITTVVTDTSLLLYANGYLQDLIDIQQPVDGTDEPLYIGIQSSGLTDSTNFHGNIDDVTLWNRSLNLAEIQAVRDNGFDPAGEPDLVAHWAMVEGVADLVHDLGPNQIDGIKIGSAWSPDLHFLGPDNPPQPPQNIVLESGDHYAQLNWLANGDYDLWKYRIYRNTVPINPQLLIEIDHPTTTYQDTGLVNGVDYYYWLTAVDLNSSPSDTTGPYSVLPNGPPRWTGLNDTSFVEDGVFSVSLDDLAYDDSDPDSSLQFVVTMDSRFQWQLTAVNHDLTIWTAADSSGFSGSVNLQVSDPHGLTAIDSFSITVQPVNDPPVITSPTTMVVDEGHRLEYHALGYDVDNVVLTWTFVDLPTWLTSSVDSVMGIPYEGASDTSFTLILSDSAADDTVTVLITVNPIDNYPIITSAANVAGREDESFTYLATGYDPEGAGLTWSYYDLPVWLSALGDSVFGIPGEGILSARFDVEASDGLLTDTLQVLVAIEAVNDAPVITSPAVAAATEDVFFSYLSQASDSEDSTLTWTYPVLPAWLQSSADSVFGTPTYLDDDTVLMAIVSDGDLSDTIQVDITIAQVDDPPLLDLTVAQAEQHDRVQLTVEAWDEEQAPVTIDFFYSVDNSTWLSATVELNPSPTSAISAGKSDNYQSINQNYQPQSVHSRELFSYVWLSGTDQPDRYHPSIWLRIDGSDGSNITQAFAADFPLDNHVGTVKILTPTADSEQGGLIDLGYQIQDITSDAYTMNLQFSVDTGQTWQTATLVNPPVDIGPDDYTGLLQWSSNLDLPSVETVIQVALSPDDGWQTGLGDTLSLQLDNVALPTIVAMSPAGSTWINWFDTFSLQLSTAVVSQTVPVSLSLASEQQGNIAYSYQLDSSWTQLTVIPAVDLTSADSLTMTITNALTDTTGDPFDGNGNGIADQSGDSQYFGYRLNYLGDYNLDHQIEFEDLLQFQQHWFEPVVNRNSELGPAIGTPPYLQVLPDSTIDFEDLMVFVQMWNWSAGFGRQMLPPAKITGGGVVQPEISVASKPLAGTDSSRLTVRFRLDSLAAVGAGELVINYNSSAVEFIHAGNEFAPGWIVLKSLDESTGELIINLADFNRGSESPSLGELELTFSGNAGTNTYLDIYTDLRDRDGLVLHRGWREQNVEFADPLPVEYALRPAYPNPFNPSTTIPFDLPRESRVEIAIYNLLGQRVFQVNYYLTAGSHTLTWTGIDQTGSPVSSGIYLVHFSAADFHARQKIVLLK